MARKSKAHPGFKAVKAEIESHPGIRDAGAVLGSAAQHASEKAKRKNPRLTKVGGVGRKGRRGAGEAG